MRSADWRFLLTYPPAGHFEHLVLLGGPRWLPDLAAELGVARKISGEIPAEGSADALVILEDAGVDLAEASRCLCSGAAVYWELERRQTPFWNSTPAWIRRRLLKAGLTPLATYWPRPDFRNASMYLPVDVPGLLGWYAETLLQPATFGRKTIRVTLKLLAAFTGSWSFRLAPRYAVTATAGPPVENGLAIGTAIPSAAGDGPELRPVVLLGGRDPSRRVIIFAFSPNAKRPSAVVKFWRLPSRNANTETEQATLRRIRAGLDTTAARSLPQPLGTVRWGGIVAAIESYAPGPPLTSFTRAWGRPLHKKLQDLTLVFDWITEFHLQAQISRKAWDGAAAQQWVEEPLASYRSAFGVRLDEERLFAAVRQRARVLSGSQAPIVWAHPDLTEANIHLQARQVTVIDWSGATARLPLFDLLYFVMLWGTGITGGRSLDARLRRFREIFTVAGKGDAVTVSIRANIRRYLQSLEISGRFFPVLLTMAWVVRSLECDERERAVARAEPGANPHPGESYVEYVRLLAKESDRLFSDSADAWWMK